MAAIVGAMFAASQSGPGEAGQSAPAIPTAESSVSVSTTIAVLSPSTVTASSESGEHHASHMVDGNPDSVWLSAPADSAATLTFEFTRPVILKEIEFDFIEGDEHGGDVNRIRRFELDVGDDAAPLTLELESTGGQHRAQFAGRVTSNVVIRVLEVSGSTPPDETAPIGFAEIRLLGVS